MRLLFSFLLTCTLLLHFHFGIAQCSVGVGPELVVNGHFDAGMVGFASDVVQGPVNCCADRWELGTNANLLHPSFTGSGTPSPMFFVCNGPTVVKRAWFQTVAVNSGTNYVFAANVCNVIDPSMNSIDPILRLTINGVPLTAPFAPDELPDVWVPICAVWNSGASTSAVLAVETMSTAAGGNDLGIDSITFRTETVLPAVPRPMLSGSIDWRANKVDLELEFSDDYGNYVFENSEDGIRFRAVKSEMIRQSIHKIQFPIAVFGSQWRLSAGDVYGNMTYSEVLDLAQDGKMDAVFAFPNPVNAGEVVQLYGFNGQLTLMNCLGQLSTRRVDGNLLETERLAPGIYWLTCISEGGNRISTKLVIR